MIFDLSEQYGLVAPCSHLRSKFTFKRGGRPQLFLLKKARHLTLIVETSEFTAFWAPVLQGAWVPLILLIIYYHLTTHTSHNFTFFRSLKPPPPLKLTFCTEFALFGKRVNRRQIRMTYFLGPRLSRAPGPPYFINYKLSPYDSYVTQR